MVKMSEGYFKLFFEQTIIASCLMYIIAEWLKLSSYRCQFSDTCMCIN